METIKVTNAIFEDVLKHRVTNLVNEVDDVWEAYKSIHDANIKYFQLQKAFQDEWSQWNTRVGTLKEIM